MSSSPLVASPARQWSCILAGGLVAGGLDIAYAWIYWAFAAGTPMTRILQSVAAGLLGRASFQGGAASAALGLFLQLFIATSMAVFYFLAARHYEGLWRRPILCGAAYGLLLYGFMNYVVVPLSRAGGGGAGRDRLWTALSILVHMLLIGVPIALSTRLALTRTSARV